MAQCYALLQRVSEEQSRACTEGSKHYALMVFICFAGQSWLARRISLW
jgi:hypothetical protein